MPRIISLDALRGFDMFWIVGGAAILRSLLEDTENPWLRALHTQFTHVEWEGFRFYDLIFPLFLFMMGVAIPLAVNKRLARGDTKGKIYRHLFIRVAVLIVLGMMVNGNLLTYDPSRFQITYSVLQTLALGYMIAVILYLNLKLEWQIVATAGLLVLYWLLLAFVPGPGHQVGVFAPGANLGDWINDWILGDLQGRWRNGWLLASMGYGSVAMTGVFAGRILQAPWAEKRKVSTLAGLGLGCLAVAVVWSGWLAQWLPGLGLFGTSWTEWPVWFPIIKARWTSSYVLYSAGWSFLLLALFYLLIDVWRFRRWTPFFVVIGCNAIFAYMCWNLGRGVFRSAGEVFVGGLRKHLDANVYEALTWAAGFALLWLLLWYLRRNRTLIRV